MLELYDIATFCDDTVGATFPWVRWRWLRVPVDEHCLAEMQILEGRRVAIGGAIQSVFLQVVKSIDDKLLKKHCTMPEIARDWPSFNVSEIREANTALVESGNGEHVGLMARSEHKLGWRDPLQFFARQGVQTFLCERKQEAPGVVPADV